MGIPQYRALKQLYIEDRIVNKGEKFFSTSFPGRQWEPLNKEAEAQCAKIKRTKAELEMAERRKVAAAEKGEKPLIVGKDQVDVAALEGAEGEGGEGDGTDEVLDENQKAAAITKALTAMDHNNDMHWTATGEPKLDYLIEEVGFHVTRADVKAIDPSFLRNK